MLKADALDFPLVRLETVIGPCDGTTRAGQKRCPSKVGWCPKDALVLLGQMVPKVGVVEATLGAPTPRVRVRVRVTAASDSVRQGQGRAGQRTETNGVGSGRLLGVGVGWTEERVVERGKREAEGRATEEGGGREGRSEKRRNGSGTEGERSQ